MRTDREIRIMLRKRWTTQSLMIITAVVGVDAAMVVQANRIGPGIEFTLFIAAVMVTLNLFIASFLKSADRMNAVPPEKQTEMVITLGCLLLVIMALMVPVFLVILWQTGR
jgi:hypothetical protein